jgi:hypothetical protein
MLQTHALARLARGTDGSLSLALPGTLQVQTADAIESLGMGFLPITQLAGKAGATFLNPREPEFRLDFLTTRHRGGL